MSRQNLIDQTEQDEVGELDAELQSLSSDELERVYNAWRDGEHGKRLISEYESKLFKQRICCFSISSSLLVWKSLLASYLARYLLIDHGDVGPGPIIEFGVRAGCISVLPTGWWIAAFARCIYYEDNYTNSPPIWITCVQFVSGLLFTEVVASTAALSMLSDGSRSGLSPGRDPDLQYLMSLYAFLGVTITTISLLGITCAIRKDDASLSMCEDLSGAQRRFLRWAISEKGADSLMPPQRGTGLVKAAITESAALNANGGGGGGGGGPGYGAV